MTQLFDFLHDYDDAKCEHSFLTHSKIGYLHVYLLFISLEYSIIAREFYDKLRS